MSCTASTAQWILRSLRRCRCSMNFQTLGSGSTLNEVEVQPDPRPFLFRCIHTNKPPKAKISTTITLDSIMFTLTYLLAEQ